MFFVRRLRLAHFLIVHKALYIIVGGLEMDNKITRVGIKRQVDKLGRIVIPKEYREFYHLNCHDEVFIVDTKDGLLITNHNYKVIKVNDKKSAR